MRISIILSCLLCYFFPCHSQVLSKHGNTSISIYLHDSQPGDTIILDVWNDLIGDGLSPSEKIGFLHKSFRLPLIKGLTKFSLASISKHAYFDLRIKYSDKIEKESKKAIHRLFTSFLIESGDNLKINIDSINSKHSNYVTESIVQSASFEGKGFAKLLCKYLTDSTSAAVGHSQALAIPKSLTVPDSLRILERTRYWAKRNRDFIFRINSQLHVLESFRKELSATAYNILKGNIIGSIQNTYRVIRGDYEDPEGWFLRTRQLRLSEEKKSEAKAATRILYRDSISELPAWSISNEGKIFSASYVSMILAKVRADVVMLYPETTVYERIKAGYSGALRDRILTWYIARRRDNPDQLDADLQNTLSFVKDPACLKELIRIKNSTNVGAKAFYFSLKNEKNRIVSFDNLRGKIVFMDFWFTGCAACSEYYSGTLSKVEDHYKSDTNVVFVSISVDIDKNKWINAVNKGLYTSPDKPNILNLYTNGQGSTDPVISNYNVVSYPHLLLIDKQGRIADNNSISGLRGANYQTIIKKIDELLLK